MRCFRPGQAALALVLGSALGAQAMTAAPVYLICVAAPGVPEGPQQALCDALAGQLRLDRQVLRRDPPPEGGLGLVLTVTQAMPQQITAHLTWRDGTAQGTTPPLSLSVEDTTLKPRMYDRLARTLIAQAGLGN